MINPFIYVYTIKNLVLQLITSTTEGYIQEAKFDFPNRTVKVKVIKPLKNMKITLIPAEFSDLETESE